MKEHKHPCGSQVRVLDDDGAWRIGMVVKREIEESLDSGEMTVVVTWHVIMYAPRRDSARTWINNDPKLIKSR